MAAYSSVAWEDMTGITTAAGKLESKRVRGCASLESAAAGGHRHTVLAMRTVKVVAADFSPSRL